MKRLRLSKFTTIWPKQFIPPLIIKNVFKKLEVHWTLIFRVRPDRSSTGLGPFQRFRSAGPDPNDF